jgi:hypothetical protein
LSRPPDRRTEGTDDVEHVMTEATSGTPDEIDPRVAELVVAIRDRFGLRGLRGARWMIEQEIALAEEALADLPTE